MVDPLRTELHPEIRAVLDEAAAAGVPRSGQLSVAGARQLAADALESSGALDDPVPVGAVREYPIAGPDGDVRLRLYTPDGEGPFPTLVWYHGGGWVRGSLDTADPICRYLTKHVGCAVASVEYRLAPEHPFPAGLRDCYTAAAWIAGNPAVVRGDGRLAVGGVSAGGNLAAAVSLMARDRSAPSIDHQLPVVPVIDRAYDTPSYDENASGYGLESPDMRFYWDHYLAHDLDGAHPYASPVRARRFDGLPPATVVTCGFDPLRDEGIAYADRLEAAGVHTAHLHYPHGHHGLVGYSAIGRGLSPTMDALGDVTESLRAAFAAA